MNEMFLALRPFGQLNYVPHNAQAVFTEVEIKLQGQYPVLGGAP